MQRQSGETSRALPIHPVEQKPAWVTPNNYAASPAWNPLTVSQMLAGADLSSRKNVSSPVPPTRKLLPVVSDWKPAALSQTPLR